MLPGSSSSGSLPGALSLRLQFAYVLMRRESFGNESKCGERLVAVHAILYYMCYMSMCMFSAGRPYLLLRSCAEVLSHVRCELAE